MQTNLARAPQALEDAAFRSMFAARKQVFIDLLKWDLPVLAGEFELDQFDTPDAEYLILLDEHGRHRASARLLPTDRPHLLGDLYPFLSDGPVPSGPSVREITRFCLDRHQTAAERRMARDQLVTALAEHALRTGITDYTGVAEFSWFSQILRFGWWCSPLGQPVRFDGRTLAALHILIDDRTLVGLRTTGVYQPLSLRLTGSREAQI
ncbi:acyl-homoserine-lactone synthase [Novosphingobium sp. BW1]|uniref:acyl-homoserine-lactone synthase n=1 Tax=Novosphingobium sp. BW1 TaxID=2592621 RepID=UPI0011DE643B|nr:acyl-homoserine-lactone synthase [Novosphingobium sp. BW1]TYC79391.1 autoinducer synthase [Novosphingobium sp. BW1]